MTRGCPARNSPRSQMMNTLSWRLTLAAHHLPVYNRPPMATRGHRSSPATKQDIEDFASLIGGYCIRAEQKIDDLETHMKQWKADLKDQVQLMTDHLRDDLGGANRDEVQMLKDRLRNVELLMQRIL